MFQNIEDIDPITLEEYAKYQEVFPNRRVEYADGHLRFMASPTWEHETIVMNTGSAIKVELRRKSHRAVCRAQIPQ